MSASFSSLLQYAFGSQYQVVCALGHDHSDRDQTAENGKRIEKGPEGTGIETSQMIVEVERYAFEQITECNTADNRGTKLPTKRSQSQEFLQVLLAILLL